MRSGNGIELLFTPEETFYGICIKAAFVAEHEWGIRSTHKKYGVSAVVNEENAGYETCINTIFPGPGIYFKDFTVENQKYTMLVSLRHDYTRDDIKMTKTTLQDYEIYPYVADSMRGAWDEHSFGVVVPVKYKQYLSDIYQAMLNRECVIIVDSGKILTEKDNNPFGKNYGLCLMINSKIPEELKNYRREKDLERYRLHKAMEETGIEKILKDAGKSYFALSPKWKDETKTELIFWLNPMQQHLYNFGWMTIQDLLDWTENKGKIMKN